MPLLIFPCIWLAPQKLQALKNIQIRERVSFTPGGKKKTTVKSWLQGFVVAEIYSLNNAKLCQKVQQKFKIYVHKWTNSGNVEEKYKEINFKYATTLLICKLIFWLVHFKMYVITVIKSMKQKSSFLNKQMQFPGNCYKRWFNTYCEQTSRRVCMKER